MRSLRKLLYTTLLMGTLFVGVSCEDLAFGDKFLQKPPSSDVTIDTIFSTSEYARRILWKSYQYLPYGMETSGYWTQMWLGTLEGLTDLNYDNVGYSGLAKVYYPGNYNASIEDRKSSYPTGQRTKCRFNDADSHMWTGIRHAWLLYENVDRVPDMDATEKSRLKAEAKMIVAIYYSHMLRHFGALPIVDHAIDPEDVNLPGRATLQATVDFIIGLLNDAINCPDFPWRISDNDLANWDGRMTKAGAMALKARVLLFVASPLFNDNAPYCDGEASSSLMTWFGGYNKERWKDAINACEEFFTALNQNGYYKLVEVGDNGTSDVRGAYTSAYYDRGTTETLISVRRNILNANANSILSNSIRWGGYCPTKEYFDMFQMSDGTDFSWDNPEQAKNPFLNRDPRLAASIVLPGAQYGSIVFIPANDQVPCGTRPRKYADIGNSDPDNCAINQIVLRYADVLLMRAEALIEANNLTDEVYTLINKVRQRVGMPTIQEAEGTNLSQEALRKILRHERRVELFLEGMRYVDMLRWKDESLVHDVYGYNRTKLSDPSSPSTWQFEKVTVATREFDSAKGWLWPIPLTDMQNNDQLTQNPGY